MPEPVYLESFARGVLRRRIEATRELLRCCTLCPRKCRVDRLSGEKGVCRTGERALVSSFNPHFGEEEPLVGSNGSGTIFFTHCNLMCLFCQNFEISHLGRGEEVSDQELARMMLRLQALGCHNLNFVTPSHLVPQILAALEIAVEAGLSIPLIYNSGGYDRVETLELLEGIFDLYMPDFKFWDPAVASSACRASDYPEVARQALREMHRQVGDLEIDDSGIAVRGLLIRHLVLPGNLAGTRRVARFIVDELSPNSYLNLMAQYRPCGRAGEVPGLSTGLTLTEYREAVEEARQEGVTRLDSRRRVFIFG